MRLFFLFAISAMFLFSCKKKEQISKKDQKIIDLLVDIHLADAMYLSSDDTRELAKKTDSASYYQPVFKKHDFTRAQYDSVINILIADMERFTLIYDEVMNRLKLMESEIMNEVDFDVKRYANDIWNLKKKYLIQGDTVSNEIEFDIPVSKEGIYTLYTKIRVYKNPSSYHPVMYMKSYGKDSTGRVILHDSTAIELVKDNWMYKYSISDTMIDIFPQYIQGKLLFAEQYPDTTFKILAEISDIILEYEEPDTSKGKRSEKLR